MYDMLAYLFFAALSYCIIKSYMRLIDIEEKLFAIRNTSFETSMEVAAIQRTLVHVQELQDRFTQKREKHAKNPPAQP